MHALRNITAHPQDRDIHHVGQAVHRVHGVGTIDAKLEPLGTRFLQQAAVIQHFLDGRLIIGFVEAQQKNDRLGAVPGWVLVEMLLESVKRFLPDCTVFGRDAALGHFHRPGPVELPLLAVRPADVT
ncbi:MAG: hypothetical protein DMG58_31325 [Acidobacteria bacterium]|nr:MAG: hypothetical protein DMG58_31325 [Acidobacteriota bacterium]